MRKWTRCFQIGICARKKTERGEGGTRNGRGEACCFKLGDGERPVRRGDGHRGSQCRERASYAQTRGRGTEAGGAAAGGGSRPPCASASPLGNEGMKCALGLLPPPPRSQSAQIERVEKGLLKTSLHRLGLVFQKSHSLARRFLVLFSPRRHLCGGPQVPRIQSGRGSQKGPRAPSSRSSCGQPRPRPRPAPGPAALPRPPPVASSRPAPSQPPDERPKTHF